MNDSTSYIGGVEVVVVLDVRNSVGLLQTIISPETHLVEDMKVTLSRVLVDNSGLLKEEVGDLTSCWLSSIEQYLNIFALTTIDKEGMSYFNGLFVQILMSCCS